MNLPVQTIPMVQTSGFNDSFSARVTTREILIDCWFQLSFLSFNWFIVSIISWLFDFRGKTFQAPNRITRLIEFLSFFCSCLGDEFKWQQL
jgi:hypothetical protein